MVDRAGEPPDRLLRRGDIHPGPLVQRAAQRPQHPLRAARSPLPGRGERVAPGQPRRHRHRDHARQGEPHAPPIPRVRQLPQPLPQRAGRPGGQRIRCEHVSSSDRLDGQRSHLTDGDLSNPCPTGAPLLTTGTARRNPPDSPLSSRRHPRPREQPSVPPSPRQPDSGHPAPAGNRKAPPGSQSRNVTDPEASLITHRYIYFAGTLPQLQGVVDRDSYGVPVWAERYCGRSIFKVQGAEKVTGADVKLLHNSTGIGSNLPVGAEYPTSIQFRREADDRIVGGRVPAHDTVVICGGQGVTVWAEHQGGRGTCGPA